MHADATRHPMKSGSVDAIVTDLPFGKKHARADNDELYPKLFAEFRRLLKPGGALVALTTLRQVVTEVVALDDEWEPRERRQVFVGGLKAYMYTVRKRP
mmetsp:Transcript_6499/g.15366  ORF Transcript_6499/g.15366 Transcript_6499/m.15366 type:complete len:99 (-) Transcript_6499:92-388(-)